MGAKENRFKTREGMEQERTRLRFEKDANEKLVKICACQEYLKM